MAKENMFKKLSESREGEQHELESVLSGEILMSTRDEILKGRPRKRKNATTMTISLDQSDKEKIKLYAYSKSLTVSDLIHQWIQENCFEKK